MKRRPLASFTSVAISFVIILIAASASIVVITARQNNQSASQVCYLLGESFDIIMETVFEPYGFYIHAGIAALLAVLVVLWRKE